jgi:hypothetical protein
MPKRGGGQSATSLQSVQNAKKRLTKLLKTAQGDVQDILEKEAQKIYHEAVALTPYKTGKLEASVYVRVSKDKHNPGLLIGASAIDPNTGYNYAGIQHENEEFNHPIKGQHHYLTIPLNKGYRRIQTAIRKRMKQW